MCSKAPQTILPFQNTTAARVRPTTALRAAQARCLRPCRRTRYRSRLRRATRRPCRDRCPTEGSPSPHRRALAQDQERVSWVRVRSPDSVHTNVHSSAHAAAAPAAAKPRGHNWCRGWGGRRGRRRRGAAGGVSPAMPVRKSRSNRPSAWRPVSGRIRGGARAAPHLPVRSSRSSVLDTSCQKKGAGEQVDAR